MIKYQGELKNYPFSAIRKNYPWVQRRVYDTLLDVTPAQLQFELDAIPEKDHYKFCSDGVDQDTYEIIGTVMSSLLDERNLILTKDDLIIIYLRFKELQFIYEAVKQGLMVTKITEGGVDYYFNVESEESSEAKQPVYYRKFLPHYRHKHG